MNYKILAIDFDGTISLGRWPEVGPANDRLISYLLDRKRYGDKLILWTCRAGAALDAAIDFCAQHDIVADIELIVDGATAVVGPPTVGGGRGEHS